VSKERVGISLDDRRDILFWSGPRMNRCDKEYIQ
jgi:hypothetical protein